MNNLRIDNLSFSYGELVIFNAFSASIAAGEITCLTGASGSGKTTLLRLLCGLEQPDAGDVSDFTSGWPILLFQEDRLCLNLSALANVRLVRTDAAADQEARRLLTDLGLADDLARPVREFSGGMKRRVALARALLAPGDVLLLDEPFKGLDQATSLTALAAIENHRNMRTTLLVSHDAELVSRMPYRLHLPLADQGSATT